MLFIQLITYNRQTVQICYPSGDKVVSLHAMKVHGVEV
jgi:hypothetical protein